MQSAALSGSSLSELMKDFKEEAKTLVKQEVQLAKTEISEKVSHLRTNGVTLLIGGFLAYAGLIVLLAALGMLLARLFEKLGLDSTLALCLGLAVIAILVVAIGGGMIMKAISGFKEAGSLAPEKAIDTLKHLKGEEPQLAFEQSKEEKKKEKVTSEKSSDEIKAGVLVTETMLQDTASELRRRVSPKYVNQRVKDKFREHPYRWNLVAMASGLASGVFIKYKIHRAKASA
jgi:hypothetical protein